MKAFGIIWLGGETMRYAEYLDNQGHSLMGTDRDDESKAAFEDEVNIITTDSITECGEPVEID